MKSEPAVQSVTRTGGRPATQGLIEGQYALSVGMPETPPPEGWQWTALSDVARLESGHTPSRKKPEYWGGDIPWIGIRDATGNHGRVLFDTEQHTNELGIANSSARLLPVHTVCLSRTASVGYVVAMGRPMATSQDFVNWVCGENLDWQFLKYVLLAEHGSYSRFAHGTTHQTIYFPEVKAFHVCLPPIAEQRRISGVLGALDDKIENDRKLADRLEVVSEAVFLELLSREGLEIVPADHVADVNRSSYSAKNHPAEIEYIDISGTSLRRIDSTTLYAWDAAPSRARRVVRSGDTLISTVRPERRSLVFVARAREQLTASTGFAVLSPRDYSPTLLYRATTSDEAIAHFAASASGSAYPAVNASVIADWGVPLPPDRGAAFEALVRPLEDRRWNALGECSTLADVRDALLPKLVSGEIRVPEDYRPPKALGAAA